MVKAANELVPVRPARLFKAVWPFRLRSVWFRKYVGIGEDEDLFNCQYHDMMLSQQAYNPDQRDEPEIRR